VYAEVDFVCTKYKGFVFFRAISRASFSRREKRVRVLLSCAPVSGEASRHFFEIKTYIIIITINARDRMPAV